MQRLIDADALNYVRVRIAHDDGTIGGYNAVVPSSEIKNAPTIDAEPHWIPVSEGLPEEPFGCLVTVWDTDPVTMDEFENILPYFVGWDGEQWNDGDGLQCPFEVIAWMPLPKPYEVENDEIY